MKRSLIILLLMLMALALLAVTAVAAEPALPTMCEHCDKVVTWQPLDCADLADTTTLASGHYYLAFDGESCESAEKTLGSSKTVCLYLNSKTLIGKSRAFTVTSGSLNIMGEGTIVGRGTTESNKFGGTLYIKTGANLNIYGGTFTYEDTSATSGQTITHGGVIYTMGTVNMTDGLITGGYASKAGSNVFVRYDGSFNMSGGEITSGTGGTGKSLYTRGCVLLAGDASVKEIYINPDSNSKAPALGDMVTIQGVYRGGAVFRMSGAENGLDIGKCIDADLTEATLSVYNSSLYVAGSGNSELTLSLTKPIITRDAYCQYCQKTVPWIGLTGSDSKEGYITTGHYYLAFPGESYEFGTKTIVGFDKICLDLNGKHLEGTDRAFHVHTGILNIMDTVGGGLVTGRGTTNDTYGGNLFVRENGTLNIYGGKFSYEDVADDGRDVVLRGGVLYIRGTVNMYGGEIYGGAAKIGGNVYVDIVKDSDTGLYRYGSLNMYGGTIGKNATLSTGAGTTGPCVYAKSLVTLSGDAIVEQVHFAVDGNGPVQGEMLTISDVFTGEAQLRFASYKEGMDVGVNANASLAGANIKITNDSAVKIMVYGDDLLAIGNDPVVVLNDTTVSGTYDSLAEAIAAYDSSMGRIVLLSDSDDDILLSKDLYVDLNGYALSGDITGDMTLYCMDASTDDYSVADGKYSRLQKVDSVKIAGIPVEFDGAEDGYLMIDEAGELSFHRVNLQISSMSLKPDEVGVYYTSNFAGDEMVKARVQSFGVALNAQEEPAVENLTTTSRITSFAQEQFNTDAAKTSSLLYGIMKTSNEEAVNKEHAAMDVYAKAYVKFNDDTYMLGQMRNRTLQEQVEAADDLFTNMTVAQMKGMLELYNTYTNVMAGWEMPDVLSYVNNLDKIANTDYTPYLIPDTWPSDVSAQAIADGKIHYYFMSGEGLNISSTSAQNDRWGDSCLIVYPNGEVMLIDSGPRAYGPVLTRNLLRMGVTEIDYLVFTHPHSDHINGAFAKLNALDENGFLNNINVKQVYHRGGYDPERVDSTLVQRICDEYGIAVDIWEKGDTIEIGGVKLLVVWPLVGTGDTLVSGGEEVNNMSVVIRFDYGEHSALFTGDLYLSGEEMVVANTDPEILDVDFMKTPHHGYLTSSGLSFLNAVSPELSVSTGFLNIPAKLRARYADCGIEFLDDKTRGYIHVTASASGEMEYTTTRNDEAIDGGEDVAPDEDMQ